MFDNYDIIFIRRDDSDKHLGGGIGGDHFLKKNYSEKGYKKTFMNSIMHNPVPPQFYWSFPYV